MRDLIDRQALLKEINDKIATIAFTSPYQDDIYPMVDGMERVRDSVEDAPTIEAEPVRHSYWESFNVAVCSGKKNRDLRVLARNCFRCDRCRHTAGASSNYCPYCGARMDGGAAGGI